MKKAPSRGLSHFRRRGRGCLPRGGSDSAGRPRAEENRRDLRPYTSPMPSHSRARAAPGPAPRVEPMPRRVDSLTGLRGLAAFGVFAFHAWLLAHLPDPAPGVPGLSQVLAWLMRIGWSGVDVFFTLSAFLLALPCARAAQAGSPMPDWRGYLRR